MSSIQPLEVIIARDDEEVKAEDVFTGPGPFAAAVQVQQQSQSRGDWLGPARTKVHKPFSSDAVLREEHEGACAVLEGGYSNAAHSANQYSTQEQFGLDFHQQPQQQTQHLQQGVYNGNIANVELTQPQDSWTAGELVQKGGMLWKIPSTAGGLLSNSGKRRWFSVLVNHGIETAQLQWHDPEKSNRKARSIFLNRVSKILRGHQSQTFFSVPASKLPPPELCFSLILPERSLDLAASSINDLELWLDGLQLFTINVSEGSRIMATPQERKNAKPKETLEMIINKWFDACYNGDVRVFSDILANHHVPVDALEPGSAYGDTCLIISCKHGYVKIAETCLRHGAANDPHPSYGQTALQAAVSAGEFACAKLLLETAAPSGMDSDIANDTDHKKNAPLHNAASKKDFFVLQLLLRHGADIGILDKRGRTVLHRAILSPGRVSEELRRDRIKCVRLLLELGADATINSQDDNGNTSVHFAAQTGDVQLLQTLLEAAANPAIANNENFKPVHFAISKRFSACVSLLEEYEAWFVQEDATQDKYVYQADYGTEAYATQSHNHESDAVVTEWVELYTEEGYAYYMNQATGESQWEDPRQADFNCIVHYADTSESYTYSEYEGQQQQEVYNEQNEETSVAWDGKPSNNKSVGERIRAELYRAREAERQLHLIDKELRATDTGTGPRQGGSMASAIRQGVDSALGFSEMQAHHRIPASTSKNYAYSGTSDDELEIAQDYESTDDETERVPNPSHNTHGKRRNSAVPTKKKHKKGARTKAWTDKQTSRSKRCDHESSSEESGSSDISSGDSSEEEVQQTRRRKRGKARRSKTGTKKSVPTRKRVQVKEESSNSDFSSSSCENSISRKPKRKSSEKMPDAKPDSTVQGDSKRDLENETCSQKQKFAGEIDMEKYGKYVKMRQLGIGAVAVRQKMTMDGITDEGLIEAILSIEKKKASPNPPLDAKPTEAVVDDSSEAKVNESKLNNSNDENMSQAVALEKFTAMDGSAKYLRMKKMGIPLPSIKQKMLMDQCDEALVKLFDVAFGLAPPSVPRPAGTQAKKGRGLLKLHWNTLKVESLENTVWAAKSDDTLPDEDLQDLEELFTSKKNVKAPLAKKTGATKQKRKSAVSSKRENNCGIGLAQFKKSFPTYDDIAKAIDQADLQLLTASRLHLLLELLPTPDEEKAMKAELSRHTEPIFLEEATSVEKFFVSVMKVPNIKSKVNGLLFQSQFPETNLQLRERLQTIISACNQIQSSQRLKQMFKLILDIGNFMNEGSFHGSASGFTLDSLLKLGETRGNDRKTTIVDYLCKLAFKKGGEELLSFEEDLKDIEAASKLVPSDISREVSKAKSALLSAAAIVEENRDNEYGSRMQESLQTITEEVDGLCTENEEMQRIIKSAIAYLGESHASCTPQHMFNAIKQFIGNFATARSKHQMKMKMKQRAKK